MITAAKQLQHGDAILRRIALGSPEMVKPGGYIGGHDFGRFRDGGVEQAVSQFIAETGLTLELDDGWTWFAQIGGGA